eukprot:TRINITY_DN6748_c0_g1_i3.p1 TRINITY_DN6748_c0_g1~~TRINITY_DN6748_c0_g1_i3.p1  ORF type:complete len:271 (-),score=24.89 TRINITY_DN6748_c0_g1_i3:965-1777(-)
MLNLMQCSTIFLLAVGCIATKAPIIGILTVPMAEPCATFLNRSQLSDASSGEGSCFNAMYAKYVEAAGGRVVPIVYDFSDTELSKVFHSVNGILFTGGGILPGDPGRAQYMHAAGLLLNLAITAKAAGDHVPVWGTCMGIQTLSTLIAKNKSVVERYAFDSEMLSLPLEFTSDAQQSRLLGNSSLPPRIKQLLTTENITSNLHHDGVTPESFISDEGLPATTVSVIVLRLFYCFTVVVFVVVAAVVVVLTQINVATCLLYSLCYNDRQCL